MARPLPDTRRAKMKPTVCRFDPAEDYRERHDRRLRTNLEAQADMEAWCNGRRVKFRVTNEGHHWQFRYGDRLLIEWWPSSAKMVVNKHWGKGIHVHDYEQAKVEIEALLKRAGAAIDAR